MESFDAVTYCPNCRSSKMKRWSELGDEERMIAAAVFDIGRLTEPERSRLLYCTRCRFVQADEMKNV